MKKNNDVSLIIQRSREFLAALAHGIGGNAEQANDAWRQISHDMTWAEKADWLMEGKVGGQRAARLIREVADGDTREPHDEPSIRNYR